MAYCTTFSLLRKNNICLCRNFSTQYSILQLFKTERHGVWSNRSMKKWFSIPRRKLAYFVKWERQPDILRANKLLMKIRYALLGIITVSFLVFNAFGCMSVVGRWETLWKKNCISWDEFVELFLSKGMVLSAGIYESFLEESEDDHSVHLSQKMEFVYIELDPKLLKQSLENGAIPRHIKTKDGKELHSFDDKIENVQVIVRMGSDDSFASQLEDCQKRRVIPPGQPIKVFSIVNEFWSKYALMVGFPFLFFYIAFKISRFSNLHEKKKLERVLASLKRSIAEPLKPEMFAERKQVFMKDVGGLHDAKAELQKVVNYLKNPSKNMVFQASRNILVTGAAGTGKRSLIRALASECQVPLISELQIFMHLVDFGKELSHKDKLLLFGETKIAWPESFMLYIDVDAMCRLLKDIDETVENYISYRDFWLKQISNTSHYVQFGVYTDADADVQKVLFSKGMFSRLIKVEMPNYEERLEIAQLCMSKYTVTTKLPDNIVKTVAQLMEGKSGEDIASLCRQTSMSIDRLKLRPDDLSDFQYACERLNPGNPVLPGIPLGEVSIPDLKEVIICHKMGHVLVALHLKNTDFIPFFPKKVCSRIGFQGFYDHMDKSFPSLTSGEALMDVLCHYIAGWAAEAVMYNTVSTGGVGTLNKIKDFLLDNRIRDSEEHASNQNGDQNNLLYPGKQMRDKILEREAQQLVGRAFKQAEQILNSEKKTLQEMIKKSRKMSQSEPKNLSPEYERERFEALLSHVPHETEHGKGFFKRRKYEDKVIRDCRQLFVSMQKPEG